MRTAAQTQLCENGSGVFVTDQERKIEIGAQLGYSDLASQGAPAWELSPFVRNLKTAAPGDWLDAAVGGWLEKMAAAPGGSLLSLALDLPEPLFDLARNGRADRLWIAPGDEILGAGAVTGFGDMSVERWRAASRRWTRLGARRPPAGLLHRAARPARRRGAPQPSRTGVAS